MVVSLFHFVCWFVVDSSKDLQFICVVCSCSTSPPVVTRLTVYRRLYICVSGYVVLWVFELVVAQNPTIHLKI